MKLFENEKLSKVNERLKELEAKKEAVQSEVNEIIEALSETDKRYSFGEIDLKDVKKAEQLLQAKTKEIADLEEMIQRVKGVRKSVAIESVPFVKEARAKKIEAIQKNYDSKVSEVITARNEFLKHLAELGRIAKEVGGVNSEFNSIMVELGENPSVYGSAINEKPVISGGYTAAEVCLGVEENIQKQIYNSGIVPNGFGGSN
jgi:DNA repair exonuclease SbcCD ATPase subunit